MEDHELTASVAAARRAVLEPGRSKQVGVQSAAGPRFELFHAAMSICSQKVRAVLAQKAAAYASHDMLIICMRGKDGLLTPAENYHPDYVRLRMVGNVGLGRGLVTGYVGVSSVASQGFDPCVVPTLVDHEKARVIVDSVAICRYIDAETVPANALIPADAALARRMTRQIEIVDATPHPAMLYGFHPEEDHRPDLLKHIMTTVYDDKVEALDWLIEQNRDDAELVLAYQAKIAKESGGKSVSRDGAFQRTARLKVQGVLQGLEADLRENGGDWLCGPSLTLADLFWGVSLIRLTYLGQGRLWSELPTVAAYFNRLRALPSLREEAVRATAASMPPSAHAAELEAA